MDSEEDEDEDDAWCMVHGAWCMLLDGDDHDGGGDSA